MNIVTSGEIVKVHFGREGNYTYINRESYDRLFTKGLRNYICYDLKYKKELGRFTFTRQFNPPYYDTLDGDCLVIENKGGVLVPHQIDDWFFNAWRLKFIYREDEDLILSSINKSKN